jgi:SAM-dependent methyltransferase
MTTADEIRDSQRAQWDGLAAGWEAWDAVIMPQLQPVTDAMLDALGVAPDQQHLDVASGTGEPGLSIATLAPRGRVVLTDLSAQMLEVAGRRARRHGLDAIESTVCSADDLPCADAEFDSVTIRFGFMFLPDLDAATRELVRVLRPGGLLVSSVWVRPEDNVWTSLVLDAVAEEVELPRPDPDRPSMFRCAAPGRVAGLLHDAGLVEAVDRDVAVELVTASPEEYWQMTSEHVSPVVAALARVDVPARQRIARSVLARLAPYTTTGGQVRVPGLARVTVARKPGPA